MNTNTKEMSCVAFQAQLPELIGSGASIGDHPHLQTCHNCSALLADLETIAQAARELFPVVEPPDELWEQIETAMLIEDASGESLGGKFGADHGVSR